MGSPRPRRRRGGTSALAFFDSHPDGDAILDALAFAEMSGQPFSLPDSGDLCG